MSGFRETADKVPAASAGKPTERFFFGVRGTEKEENK